MWSQYVSIAFIKPSILRFDFVFEMDMGLLCLNEEDFYLIDSVSWILMVTTLRRDKY